MNTSVLLIILFALLGAANAESFYAIHSCSNTITYPPNTTYGSDLRDLLATLSNALTSHFSTASTKTGERIQALYQCRNDISLDECASCISNATTAVLQKCPTEKTAVIWYDNCLLRFSNETIISVLRTSPAWYLPNTNNISDPERANFTGFVISDLNDCATEAANSPLKFAVRERITNLNVTTGRIYSLVQCTGDVSNEDCSRCLQDALGNFPSCCSYAVGARVLMPSCSFRYEIYSFYNVNGSDPASSPSHVLPFKPSSTEGPSSDKKMFHSSSSSGKKKFHSPYTESTSSRRRALSKAAIFAIIISIGLFSVIFGIGCAVFLRRCRSTSKVKELGAMREEESLVFSLNTLKAATNNFSSQNLLGHGGYGDVFKGALENGTEIAVKRLMENSSQGETEFRNEVNLVANLQHRNLTRLLGFCLEGDERILVYEYVHNKSLDRFLFEKEGGGALEWAQRYKIIEGIARGMLYLHEDSRLKIIHRDLKASNVLLDGYLNPKISDFGTARICGVDETGMLTYRVIGTRGYIAPEYGVDGAYSVKSDVYSFGVLVLEIVTGLKAAKFHFNDNDGCGDLIDFVWKHWNDKTLTEVVDKGMKQSYSEQEVLRCVHVALLCVEESPLDRPTMATVFLMLRESSTVKLPMQPFINRVSGSKFSETKSPDLWSSNLAVAN